MDEDAQVAVSAGDKTLEKSMLAAGGDRQEIGPVDLPEGERVVVRITVFSGRVEIEEIVTE